MAAVGRQTPADLPHDSGAVVQRVALPLHVQMLQKSLTMDHFIHQFDQLFSEYMDPKNPLTATDTSQALDPQFNFENITEERKWVKDLLCSKSDNSGSELSETEQLQILLELQHKKRKIRRKRLKKDSKLSRYKYLSAGLLSKNDPYPEHLKTMEQSTTFRKPRKPRKVNGGDEVTELKRQEVWAHIVKKDIPRMAKQFSLARHTIANNTRKIAHMCVREVRKLATKSQRASKEVSGVQPRARRLMREALIYWRRFEKVEREQRKKAEKEATEQNKLNQEMMEAKRQQRKLNFLITQTELYAHFMAKKLTGEEDNSAGILGQLEDGPVMREVKPGVVVQLERPGDYDCESIKAQVMANVQSAMHKQQTLRQGYNDLVAPQDGESMQESFDKQFSLATPMLVSDREMPQPTMFNGMLKSYQLKGMNWLANLYDQGINGILADEMGLGKTVQSIAFLSHLAENQNNWGPFLIVSPASTLHNWQQEASRFVPKLKALPYWGSPPERKVIRKYWNPKLLCKENAPFHILITSYQLVVQDMKYFQRVKWQYMILDEAQAIKSSTSVRWKVLLSFNCRNRLLLTGTPIQNTMQELWALLHFIMPTMFDSHEEFNEWFSKDIESHAEKRSVLDEHQLSRLHLILKPFMLRRIKKDVEHEMAEKIEIHLSCELSTRQRLLYHGLRERISVEQLLQSASTTSSKDSASSHLLNLVMQFRKVCNHPDLFERRNVDTPVSLSIPPYTVPRLVYNSTMSPDTHQLLTVRLGLHTAHSVHCSSSGDGLWSFLRLLDLTPAQGSVAMMGSLPQRLGFLLYLIRRVHLLYQQRLWNYTSPQLRGASNQLLVWPSLPTSHCSRAHSPTLSALIFTSPTSPAYCHYSHNIHPLNHGQHVFADLTEISSTVTNQDEKKSISELSASSPESSQSNTGSLDHEGSAVRHCVLTFMPKFLITCIPKALVSIPHLYCSDRGAEHARLEWLSGGPPHIKQLFLYGLEHKSNPWELLDNKLTTGLTYLHQPNGWSHIHIPNKETMIYDSGKMVVLDKLLTKLKHEGHRVLIYSQMTRVIDLLEEFMAYRRHKFIRLDGSSRISDRRDMVADFQTNSEIFAFLLSTRAGGLGINLTAADTVIFYDSDWNPTVDQQAMDRAHRLGQTKQVTVYRLIVRGSIEERILQRAREKSEIQKMVISGGDFKPDALKAKDMVSLLLHDDEMETRFLAKQAEKKASLDQLQQAKKYKSKRKNPPNGTEVEPASKRTLPMSASPSPLLNFNRPDSVMSFNSAATNGDDLDTVEDHDNKPGGTPVREVKKRTPTRRTGKISSAPLGGRGRMQRSGKKPNSGSAAASAGAIAGALAANNAAFASYGGLGYIVSPHPGGSPGSALNSNHGSSTHSSPRTSPQPFVATSLTLSTPPHKNSKAKLTT